MSSGEMRPALTEYIPVAAGCLLLTTTLVAIPSAEDDDLLVDS